MIKEQFPTPYDVEQTIIFRNTSQSSLKKFIQSLGIFTVGKSKKDVADFVSSILLEHKDYLHLRRLAQGGEEVASISGFTLRNKLTPQSTEDLMNDFIQFRNELEKNTESLRQKGASTPKLSHPIQIADDLMQFQFEYQRLIPGRIELMQRIDSQVDFTIEKIRSTQWRVVCYPQANEDVKTVEKLFKKMGSGTYETFSISLEPFTQRKRIEFFDRLLQYYTEESQEWIFEQVTEITIRQSAEPDNQTDLVLDEEINENIDEVEFVGEDELEEVNRNDLQSITQAILQGKNLRTNSFVQDCEKQGFYFSSMTLELGNRHNAELIQIRIRFKLSPKMFEVILVSMAERDEMGVQIANFAEDHQQEILNEFWNVSHRVWDQLKQDLPGRERGQMSFSDYAEIQEKKLQEVV